MKIEFKRAFTALLLSAATLCGCISAYAGGFDDTGDKYTREIDMVTGAGFMEGENSKFFYPDDYVDNAELVQIIMNLRNSDVGDRKRRFTDVSESYYAFNEIDEAVALGYIKVGADRRFYPEEKATTERAVKLILYLLNYKEFIAATNADIYSLARTVGLLDSVTVADTYITKGTLAKLLYNSFKCGQLEYTGGKGDSDIYGTSEDKTALSWRGLKLVEGIVTANEGSSMYSTGYPAARGRVVIDGDEYIEGGSGCGRLLGYSVEAICVDDNDDGEVIYATAGRKNKTLTVDGRDIESVENMVFTYDQRKKVRLKADMCLIYNGTAVEFDEKLLDCGDGSITFLNNGDSSNYNVVLINAYESYVVSGVNENDAKIYLKNGQFNNDSCIDIGDDGNTIVHFYKDSEEIDISEIKDGNVISVFYSSGALRIFNVQVSDKVINGELTGSDYDTKRKHETVIIDGKEYIIGKNAAGKEKIELGKSFAASMDFKGNILNFEYISGITKGYAALLRVSMDTEKEELRLKLLNSEGKIKTYIASDTKIPLVKGDTREKVELYDLQYRLDALQLPALLVVETDEEEHIRRITLPAAYNSSDMIKNESMFTYWGEYTANTLASYGYLGDIGTDSAKIFIIPNSDENGKIDDEDCAVSNGGYFNAGTSYRNIKFYDVGIAAQAGAVLVRATKGSELDNYEGGVMLVKKVSATLNYDDEVTKKITGLMNGSETEINISPQKVYNVTPGGSSFDIKNIGPGDVLMYNSNSAGELSVYAMIYTDSADSNSLRQLTNWGNGMGYTRECSAWHGYVRYKSDKALTIEYDGKTVPAQVTNKNNVFVYKVNRSYRTVETASYGDIAATNYYTGKRGSEVVMRSNRNGVVEVIIYED